MKIASFTIVAKNYFGLAEVLGKSIKQNNPEVDFHIFIADEFDDDITKQQIDQSKFFHYLSKDVLGIDTENWYNNAFKYNVTEFCTYLKPYCFKYLFHEYDKVIYFDPDIFVYSSLSDIYNELDANFIVLTPHITTMEVQYTGEASELDILGAGIYNLGFIGLKKSDSAAQLIDWWASRLEMYCFDDKADNLFTDQKWLNFIFSFFNTGICISRDLGRNMAPWNFHERAVIKNGQSLEVYNRITGIEKSKLIFVHYSGFNYKNLKDSNLNLPKTNFNKFSDLKIIFESYEEKLLEGRIGDFLKLNYSYSVFDNHVEIFLMHRRFYRRILNKNNKQFFNPFFTDEGSFYKTLLNKKLVDDKPVKNHVDRLQKDAYDGYYKKTVYINRFFSVMKWLLGYKKYYLLTKFFTKYFKIENQLFLFDPNDTIKPK